MARAMRRNAAHGPGATPGVPPGHGLPVERYSCGRDHSPWRSLMRTNPWHSILQNVHHDNTSCTEGNNIEPQYRRPGSDGKPLCAHCARLDATGR